MLKTSTELLRHSLNGATMGTRWAVVTYLPQCRNSDALRAELQAAFQAAVDGVDAQMSTWKPESDLMRLNAAPQGQWVSLPDSLMVVLREALFIGRESGGAFEIAMGDAIRAWGFGPDPANVDAIRAARARKRVPSYATLELDAASGRARKHADMVLDLNGIAKGYGVDRLIEVAQAQGLAHVLASIDGELRSLGRHPDGRGWAVALEQPDPKTRAVHSVFDLHDVAVATSGNYRHWVELGGKRLSHTMDPARGAPLHDGPASVTVLAETSMRADALASACMVMGEVSGRAMAARLGAEALFLCDAGPKEPEHPRSNAP